jgi:NAD(P)-dependent dehydrogenase (short-subunit alcohol dehydrogenase family)
LQDKVAIITGAAGGIGEATVRRIAAEGARVVLVDLDGERASAIAASLPSPCPAGALVQVCDVGDEKAVTACVAATLERFKRLDAIINNAGAVSFKPLTDWAGQEWERLLRVDLLGAAFFTGEALKHMNEGGAIVNVASIHALMTTAEVAPYAAAKAALLSLTRSTAIEGKPRRIRANAILPGAIDTPMLWNNPNVKAGVEKIDKTDIGAPEDIANAALFLISDEARFINGTSLVVDGGRTIRL